MLVVNADDWGRSAIDTDATLACLDRGRCTSVSAMVFMADSERAARIANERRGDVGLHLNFSEDLTSPGVPESLRRAHARTRRFLRVGKYAQLVYNPLLDSDFNYVVGAQIEEFLRLYSREPSHIDGHQHLHLCANLLVRHPIPDGNRVRRSFSFARGEKSLVNRAYRAWVDRTLSRRYRLTDYFFALSSSLEGAQLDRIASIARHALVELMTHPRFAEESECLLGDRFGQAIEGLELRGHTW